MTFVEYLRSRRTYTEGMIALRQELERMPTETQDHAEVQVWLLRSGASTLARITAAEALRGYRERQRREAAPPPVPRDRSPT